MKNIQRLTFVLVVVMLITSCEKHKDSPETPASNVTVEKRMFVEQQTLKGTVVAVDSLEIYKAACAGIWTVKEYELGKHISTWRLELSADGSGTYSKPGTASQLDIRWYISESHDGYRCVENVVYGGPWSYLEKSSVIYKEPLTFPVTSFSRHYIGTTVTYIKD